MKFRKKPVVIEAEQFVRGGAHLIIDFTEGKAISNTCYEHLTIPTLEGPMKASPGDWIIKGVSGEFYPCKSDIFEKTYDKVEE